MSGRRPLGCRCGFGFPRQGEAAPLAAAGALWLALLVCERPQLRQHLVERLPVGRLQLALDFRAQALAVVVMDLQPERPRPPRDAGVAAPPPRAVDAADLDFYPTKPR